MILQSMLLVLVVVVLVVVDNLTTTSKWWWCWSTTRTIKLWSISKSNGDILVEMEQISVSGGGGGGAGQAGSPRPKSIEVVMVDMENNYHLHSKILVQHLMVLQIRTNIMDQIVVTSGLLVVAVVEHLWSSWWCWWSRWWWSLVPIPGPRSFIPRDVKMALKTLEVVVAAVEVVRM